MDTMKKIIIILTLIVASVTMFAQPLKVTGVVLDEQGMPLIGAGIFEQGNDGNGTVTDIDGLFSISVKGPGAIILVSNIGYETQELKASTKKMTIRMVPSAIMMEESVVVGYGTQKKESVVGSISVASSEDLKQMGTPNLSNALAGKVAGITFTVASGRPGADAAQIYIRGKATMSGDSAPLVLVDGVERDFGQVDPEDVESLSVLKDASATAVYGVRGANGVILITTKRGNSGAPKVNFSYGFTLQQPTKVPNWLGSYDHAILRNEALANDGMPPAFSEEDIEHYRLHDAPYTHPDNDYVKDFLRKVAPMQKFNLGVRGGSDKVQYYFALGGLFQDGLYQQFDGRYACNANYWRLNLRSNLDFKITKTTTLSLDLNARLDKRTNVSGGIDSNNIFALMYETPPMYYPYRLPDGSYGSASNGGGNLLSILSDQGYSQLGSNTLEGTVRLVQKMDFITKGLSARAMYSFNSYFDKGNALSYTPAAYRYISETEKELIIEEKAPSISNIEGKGHRRRENVEAGLDYSRRFGDHDVTAMALYTMTTYTANANLPRTFLGFAGRATYSYLSRYLAEFNVGYNGSDAFDKGHRYAVFPSFALGYIISNENFVKNHAPWITFMKIRGSYGMVGNDKIGTNQFVYLQTYDNDGNYFFGKDGSFGKVSTLKEGDLGNTNVTWEVGYKANVGVDMTFFERLTFNVDLFQEIRDKIFITRNTLPQTLGVGSGKENLGKVRNRGFEIEAKYSDKIGKNFNYYVTGMFSYSKNKILFQDEVEPKYEYLRRTGNSMGQFYGQTVLRYYLPDDFIINEVGERVLNPELPQPAYPVQPGDFMYWDRNEDGFIDTFDEGPIGKSRIPMFVYNFSAGFNYKQFDFNVMFQGAGGCSKLMTKSLYEPVREENRFQEIHKYRWTEERWRNGDKILYPRLSSNTNKQNQITNTFYLKKGDYLRLKNIELGYTFSKKQLRLVRINSLRLYASGNNLLTFSEIKNFDPEMGSDDGYFYPQLKMWNVGININF